MVGGAASPLGLPRDPPPVSRRQGAHLTSVVRPVPSTRRLRRSGNTTLADSVSPVAGARPHPLGALRATAVVRGARAGPARTAGPAPPGERRAATDAPGRRDPPELGSSRATTADRGWPLAAASATHAPTRSWARRNGVPAATSASATSMATRDSSSGGGARGGLVELERPVRAGHGPQHQERLSAPRRRGAPCPPGGRGYTTSGRPLSVASRPARWPTSRPDLPRASSATSLLRFWGSIDDPVVNSSPSAREAELRRRPQDELLAHARQVHAEQREVEEKLGDEVPVAHGVHRVREDRGEAQLGRGHGRVDRQRRPGQRPRAQGRDVQAVARVHQPVDVAQQRPRVGARGDGSTGRVGRAGGACSPAGPRRGSGRRTRAAPPPGRGRRARPRPAASRANRRKVVATWSLRLRAVCRRAPTSPQSSVTRRSIAMWMSSSSAARTNAPRSNSASTSSSAATRRPPSASLKQPRGDQPGHVGPRAAQVVGVEDVVERVALGELPQRLRHGRAEAPRPERHGRRGAALRAPWRAAHVFTPRP